MAITFNPDTGVIVDDGATVIQIQHLLKLNEYHVFL